MQSKNIEQYMIGQRLGKHLYGESFSAIDSGLERPVVVKLLNDGKDIKADTRRNFLNLMQNQAGLSLPCLADFYSLETSGDRLFIVREYVEGIGVGRIAETEPVYYSRFLELAGKIVQAIKSLHDAGYMIGNLHSNNILIEASGEIRLLDLGVASLTGRSIPPQEEDPVYRYMAPEVFRGEPGDSRSDLFSLGVIFYELLTGRLPFTRPDQPRSLKDEVPAEIIFETRTGEPFPGEARLLLEKLMAQSPDNRIFSTEILLTTLEAILSYNTAPVSPKSLPATRRSPRQFLVISLLAVLLIILWLVVTTVNISH